MASESNASISASLEVIGVIRTPFLEAAGTPIQPAYGRGAEEQVWVAERYVTALDDLEGFERIWLIYWMDRAGAYRAKVVPFRDTQERGLFATRSPSRPNPIGMSAVRLVRREGRMLHIADLDILDGTQLLDIKPYVPAFDAYPDARAGWFDRAGADRRLADERFGDRE